jgi:hypothetical protein
MVAADPVLQKQLDADRVGRLERQAEPPETDILACRIVVGSLALSALGVVMGVFVLVALDDKVVVPDAMIAIGGALIAVMAALLVPGSCQWAAVHSRLIGLGSWRGRAVIVAVSGVAALVVAGRSLAAVTPHLVVTSRAAGEIQTLSISGSRQASDDPVGRIQLFVPTGFTLNSPAAGIGVGTVTAKVAMPDVNPGAAQSWSGSVTAISPTDPAVAYEGTSCDSSPHLAAWIARLRRGTKALSFPIFVDATSDTAASFGPYRLVACFRPADLPPTDPNRAPNGAVVDSFTLALTPFLAPTTAGRYLWRSLWTPFAPATGALNDSGTVEAQSTVEVLTGEILISSTKTRITVRGTPLDLGLVFGRVLVGGEPQAAVIVRIRHGADPSKLVALGRVRTGSDGVYVDVIVLRGSQYLQASADLPVNDLGTSGCHPSFADIPCLDATTSAGHVVSSTILIKL